MSEAPPARLFEGALVELVELVALAAPRRAVPIALVGVSLLSEEWIASRSPVAMLLDAALLATFCACAPGLWRALFAREPRAARDHLVAWSRYTLAAAALVGVVAMLLPRLVGLRWTYVSEPCSPRQ